MGFLLPYQLWPLSLLSILGEKYKNSGGVFSDQCHLAVKSGMRQSGLLPGPHLPQDVGKMGKRGALSVPEQAARQMAQPWWEPPPPELHPLVAVLLA